jgi:sec-independent protein translocase protein TatC
MPEPKLNREDYLKERKQTVFVRDFTMHLQEMRSVILISLASLLLFFIIAFYYADFFIEILKKLAPLGSSFFQLKPGELFMSSLKVGFFVAFYFSFAIIISQIYFFVKPALKEQEKQIVKGLSVFIPVLFYLGLVFAYFFILPPLLDFLLNFKEGLVEKRYGLESFLNLVLSIETVTAIAFQLPVLVFLLGIFNIVSVKQLFAIWRYVILGAFIVSAFLTPTPDPLTMSVLACALLVLYFSTILILKLIKR